MAVSRRSSLLVRFAIVWMSVNIGAADVCGQQATVPKLTVADCVRVGLERQPALKAARASVAASQAGLQGLSNLRLSVRLIRKDIPIRIQQASLGVVIASAGLQQGEWEMRYAVVRNFFSVLYAREQLGVAKRIVETLTKARNQAAELAKEINPKIKVDDNDVRTLTVNLVMVQTKVVEAQIGVQKAEAALREAMGVDEHFCFEPADGSLPQLQKGLDRQMLVAMALHRRGELAQAANVFEVTRLEIEAQGKIRGPQGTTFASGSDVHARPIPQGVSNTQYRPGAIGLEMPTVLVGNKSDRVDRACDLHQRASAVVEKTRNLIRLEVEVTYLKWKQAYEKAVALKSTIPLAKKIYQAVEYRFNAGKKSGEEYLQAKTLEDQTIAQYNEALYKHALALAALERVTSGGYRILGLIQCGPFHGDDTVSEPNQSPISVHSSQGILP